MTDGKCEPITVSRRIEAPADKVFRLLVHPAMHPLIDGSGMLRATAANSVISGVGEVFTMKMHNAEMGDYEITNHVVEFEQDRRISWEPVLSAASRAQDAADIGARAQHRWGYELTPVGPSTTDVTEIFDCSRAPDWLRKVLDNGNRWVESMRTTLAKLDEQSTAQPADARGG